MTRGDGAALRVVRGVAGFILSGLLLAASDATASPILTESFDNVASLVASGWLFANNSAPLGTTGWFQGNPAVFLSQAGAPNSYIAANFLNAAIGGDISNWLITPALLLNNGDTLTFYSRSAGIFADRLEVRLSTTGANVGGTSASVGDFTTLLLTINPALSPSGYPDSWVMFSVNVSGLGGPTSSRFGFRYFVPDTNINANYIGIDTISANSVVPEPSTLTLFAFGAAAAYVRGRRRSRSAVNKDDKND